MPLRLATLLALLALAGCGSAGAPVKTNATSFSVTLDDFTLRPQELRVPKGKPLKVTVTNAGRLGHTFRIRGATRNVLTLTTIRPGESKTSKSFDLAPGHYTMYCALANHEELGLYGKLTVG
jgi:plastocyanin